MGGVDEYGCDVSVDVDVWVNVGVVVEGGECGCHGGWMWVSWWSVVVGGVGVILCGCDVVGVGVWCG